MKKLMKKNKIRLKKFTSFKAENKAELQYYKQKTPEERLSDIQFCREQFFKLSGINENRKRLRRVFRIIKQT